MAARKPKTDVATIDGKTGTALAPNDIAAQVAAMLAKQQGTTGSTATKGIKITQDKKFEHPDGTKTDTVDVVIVDYGSYNAYYEGRYDPKNIQPPLCAAKGKVIIELVPFENATERQSDSCEVCPMNQFGSAQSGAGKACKNSRLMALLPADFDEETEVTTLGVSATAIKRFDKFVGSIAAKGMVPLQFKVELSFDPNETYPSLVFTAFEQLPIELVGVAMTKLPDAEKLLNEPVDFTPRENEAAKPAAKKPASRAAAKPAAAAGGRRKAVV